MKFGAIAFAISMACALPLHADEVRVCYNYGCLSEGVVRFDAATLDAVAARLAAAADAADEREALAEALGTLYREAGRQTPIWRDRGGNYNDGGNIGKMDCIDHSTTTGRFLRLIEGRGWLRFHEVRPVLRRVRFFVDQHWTARIAERAGGAEYAVDSWFVDNGRAVPVMPIADWLAGEDPEDD